MNAVATKPGQQLAIEAIRRVDEAANAAWMEAAVNVILYTARHSAQFTTDRIWHRLEKWYPELSTPEPRAMGAAMTRARGWGWIRATDRTRKSKRPQCNGRPLRIWESRLARKETR